MIILIWKRKNFAAEEVRISRITLLTYRSRPRIRHWNYSKTPFPIVRVRSSRQRGPANSPRRTNQFRRAHSTVLRCRDDLFVKTTRARQRSRDRAKGHGTKRKGLAASINHRVGVQCRGGSPRETRLRVTRRAYVRVSTTNQCYKNRNGMKRERALNSHIVSCGTGF